MLKKGFVLLGLIAIAGCMILAVGINRSIVRPIKALTRATQEIARGNLHKPVSISTSDEIGLLAKSFDQMRVRLAQSLQHIQRHAQELELQVAERTKDLLQSRQRLSKLLEQTISAQEDERKRIARELHDEITQPLNALLISLELMDMSLKQDTHLRKNISQLRQHLLEVLQSIHSLIKDLRPPVIDDFGLESAVVWLLQRHLSKAGIEFVFRTHGRCTEDPFTGSFRCADLEFAIFRVVQEAIVNIVKHSRASMVAVALLFSPSSVRIEIEDDGEGFDVHKAFASTKGPGTAGLGLLGMKERIALLDGRFTICSWPGGGGTHISITVPL
jgi:signal transduction histidine kinase